MTPPDANDCDPVERDSSNEEDDNDQVTGEGSEGDQEPHLDDVSASAANHPSLDHVDGLNSAEASPAISHSSQPGAIDDRHSDRVGASADVLGFATAAEKVKKFPQTPGVYLMKDVAGVVIYVGKAKNLPS